MKILVTGNMGYVGPVLCKMLKGSYNTELIGYDTGFFAHCLTATDVYPEVSCDFQVFGDIRKLNRDIFSGVDIVVHLAAISNDPMGSSFAEVTEEINAKASDQVAQIAKAAGVRKFIFASSCSMYGSADEREKKETDALNPLTAYAKSKVFMEEALEKIADESFQVTCLRFSTACGMSPRLRLDLVLNDFVASALCNGVIQILSDGTPWRPLIDVKDMARAIEWAIDRTSEDRTSEQASDFLAVNVGRNQWNYQVVELANAVAKKIPGTKIDVNKSVPPDKRSYRVDFSLFERLAPDHLPRVDLAQSIDELIEGLRKMNFSDVNFRDSEMIRLRTLHNLQSRELLDKKLFWNN